MARNYRFKASCYTIGFFDKDRKEFRRITHQDGHIEVYVTRDEAEKAIPKLKKEFACLINKELVVVHSSVAYPKFKYEMTHAEIEKALGKKIIIVK